MCLKNCLQDKQRYFIERMRKQDYKQNFSRADNLIKIAAENSERKLYNIKGFHLVTVIYVSQEVAASYNFLFSRLCELSRKFLSLFYKNVQWTFEYSILNNSNNSSIYVP